MDDNLARHNATGRDESRPDATGPDYDYSLTIEETADRYAMAGHPRTIRTLQRYCASGHLDCRKMATTYGDKYVVAPYSVTRHIGQINEVTAFTERTTSRDEPRPAATHVASQPSHEMETSPPATSPDMSRQDATGNREVREGEARYIAILERARRTIRSPISPNASAKLRRCSEPCSECLRRYSGRPIRSKRGKHNREVKKQLTFDGTRNVSYNICFRHMPR
jgi:hypothetical protein